MPTDNSSEVVDFMLDNQSEPRDDLPIDDKPTEILDQKGTVFDPNLHQIDDDGKPKIGKRGTFLKKRGRKQAQPASIGGLESENTENTFLYKANGKTSALMLISVGRAIGGDEWKASREEQGALADAFANYYTAKGIPDMPPGFVLSVAILGYVLPRLSMPTTKSRLSKIKNFIKTKVFRQKNARSDIGPN